MPTCGDPIVDVIYRWSSRRERPLRGDKVEVAIARLSERWPERWKLSKDSFFAEVTKLVTRTTDFHDYLSVILNRSMLIGAT